MSRQTRSKGFPLFAIAALGSAGLLAGAFFFELVMGLPPCQLCLWQRWPHALAFALGALMLAFPRPQLALLGALAAASSGVLGVYHTGVERGWWEGPGTCSGTGGSVSNLTAEQLLERVLAAPVVRCTDVAWEMLGLSMASWNAIISFGLAALWLAALARR